MTERMYWRSTDDGHLDWCYGHHEQSVKHFDAAPHWERVHVLTDAELAQVAADAREETEGRLSELLCDMTGGKLSKPTYSVQTMASEIEEHVSKYAIEDTAERIERAIRALRPKRITGRNGRESRVIPQDRTADIAARVGRGEVFQ